jgi:multiple sugar transport system substrate-binding protein
MAIARAPGRRPKGQNAVSERRGAQVDALDRRGFLKVTGAAGLAGLGLLGVPGCGGDDGGGGGGGGGGDEPVTLRWSMWSGSPEETKIWQDLADEVKKKYPNITVKLETTTFNTYWDKLQTQIASKTQADIVGMQAQRMPGFAARQALAPMKEHIDKDSSLNFPDYFKVIEDALSYKGEVLALAYDLGPPLLYYNKDLFAKAKVDTPSPTEPMSWDEFKEMAEKLTDTGSREYGYIQSYAFDPVIPWLWSNGGDYMNEDASKSTLNSPESMEALQFLSDLFNKDKVAAPITDLADANFALTRFWSGKVGMHMDGPWQVVNMRANIKDFEWDIAPVPAGKADSSVWAAGSGFGISSATDNADAAYKAISVITGEAALKSLTRQGRGYPARQSAVPIFEGEAPPENATVVQKVLNSEIGKTQPFRSTATWQETNNMLVQDLLPAVYLGKPTVQQAVQEVTPKFDALLKRAKDIESRGD